MTSSTSHKVIPTRIQILFVGLSSCLLLGSASGADPTITSSPNIAITIHAPHETEGYPFTQTLDSYPPLLSIELSTDHTTAASSTITRPLFNLKYFLDAYPGSAANPPQIGPPVAPGSTEPGSPPPCTHAYYSDSIDLYGKHAPGILVVNPHVPIPPGVGQLTICVRVTADLNGTPQIFWSQRTIAISPPPRRRAFRQV